MLSTGRVTFCLHVSGTALCGAFKTHSCFILFKLCFSCVIMFLFLGVDWWINKQTHKHTVLPVRMRMLVGSGRQSSSTVSEHFTTTSPKLQCLSPSVSSALQSNERTLSPTSARTQLVLGSIVDLHLISSHLLFFKNSCQTQRCTKFTHLYIQ